MLISMFACNPVGSAGEANPADEAKKAKKASMEARVPSNPQGDVLQQISDSIASNPQSDSLYYQRSVIHLQNGNDDDGFYDLYKAIQLNPTVVKYYTAGANFYVTSGDIRSAEELLNDGRAVLPNAYAIPFEQAKLKLYIQDYDASISLFRRSLELKPKHTATWLYQGVCYHEMGDQEKATKSLKKAVDIDPDYHEALYLLGQYHRADNYGLSLAYYKNALRVLPDNPDIIYAIGTLHQEHEALEKAKKSYREILFLDRQYEDAFYNLGYIYLQQDSVAEAKRHFDMCLAVTPNSARAYYMRGRCAELAGDKIKALDDYEQALVFDEKMTEALEASKRLKNKK